MSKLKNIFEYEDYRAFLADYYDTKKASEPPFSYNIFSQRAGFSNKGFLYSVIHGGKNLSKPSIDRLAQAMELAKPEARYFENLVFYNQAKNFRDREHFFSRMNEVRANNPAGREARKLREDQFEYFSNWYNTAIRSILSTIPFSGDFEWLANMVRPKITRAQAQAAVLNLERLGLVEKTPDGIYRIIEKAVTTDPEVKNLAVQRFHLDMLERAAEAVRNLPRSERNVTANTVSISEESYNKICDMIWTCQQEILKLAQNDPKADRVYQINTHVFPISQILGKESGK